MSTDSFVFVCVCVGGYFQIDKKQAWRYKIKMGRRLKQMLNVEVERDAKFERLHIPLFDPLLK